MVINSMLDDSSRLFWSVMDDISKINPMPTDNIITMVDNYSTYKSIIKTVKQFADEGLLTPSEAECLNRNVDFRLNKMFKTYLHCV